MTLLNIIALLTLTKFSVVGLHVNDKLADGRGSELAGVWALTVEATDKATAEKTALRQCASRAPKEARCQASFTMPFNPDKPCHAMGIGLFEDTKGYRRDWEGSAGFASAKEAEDHATELLKENMFGMFVRVLKMANTCGGVS